MDVLSSLNNDRIKTVKKLLSSPKERKYSGKYVVENRRMVREIPLDDLDEMYFTQHFYDKYVVSDKRLKHMIAYAEKKDKCFIVTDEVFGSMCDTDTPQGIVATVKIRKRELKDLLGTPGEKPFILIVERLQDPGNLGTLIRTAEGAGVTGILISYDSADIYNPKVVRSTMGSIFRKKIVVSYDLIGDVEKLKQKEIKIFGMHLDGSSMYETDLTGAVAFLIGNEGAGLTPELCDKADKLIRIPMKGEVESLNAAISASLISYETMRQRSGITFF